MTMPLPELEKERTSESGVAPALKDEHAVPRTSASAGRKFLTLILTSVSILFAIAIGLVVGEIAMRVLGLGEDDYLKPDPIVGMTHLENKHVTFRMEGFSRQAINSAGFRDVEHATTKPPLTKRILFLGDSQTEGLQVPLRDTFVKQIERRLKGRNGERVETINLAMASSSTIQEYLQYLWHGRDYKADVVVLVYNIMDSTENGLPSVKRAMNRPCAYFNKSGRLELTFELLDKWLQAPATRFLSGTEWWRRNSHLYQTLVATDFSLRINNKLYPKLFDKIYPLFDRAFSGVVSSLPAVDAHSNDGVRDALKERTRALDLQLGVDKEPVWPELPPDTTKSNPTGQPAIYRAHLEETRSNFLVTARLVRLLNRACLNDGSKLVVVTLPSPRGYTLYLKETALIKQMGVRDGFQVIDTSADFPSVELMEKNPYYFSVHLSPLGHRKIADIILRSLRL